MPQSPKRRSTSAKHRSRITEPVATTRPPARSRRVTVIAWIIVLTFGLGAVLPALILLFG